MKAKLSFIGKKQNKFFIFEKPQNQKKYNFQLRPFSIFSTYQIIYVSMYENQKKIKS